MNANGLKWAWRTRKKLTISPAQARILARSAEAGGIRIALVRRWVFFRRFPSLLHRDVTMLTKSGLIELNEEAGAATANVTAAGLMVLAYCERDGLLT